MLELGSREWYELAARDVDVVFANRPRDPGTTRLGMQSIPSISPQPTGRGVQAARQGYAVAIRGAAPRGKA